MTCPKCGADMVVLPDTEWQLHDVRTVDYICPNCLHVEKVDAIIVDGGNDAVQPDLE